MKGLCPSIYIETCKGIWKRRAKADVDDRRADFSAWFMTEPFSVARIITKRKNSACVWKIKATIFVNGYLG